MDNAKIDRTREYIATMTRELADLAASQQMKMGAYLLLLAEEEFRSVEPATGHGEEIELFN